MIQVGKINWNYAIVCAEAQDIYTTKILIQRALLKYA